MFPVYTNDDPNEPPKPPMVFYGWARYPDGTPVGTVVSSIEPSGAMYAIWRLNASPPSAMGPAFEGFAPAAPQASDLESVGFLEAVFLCVSVPATVTMPAVQPRPYPIPMPESTAGPESQS